MKLPDDSRQQVLAGYSRGPELESPFLLLQEAAHRVLYISAHGCERVALLVEYVGCARGLYLSPEPVEERGAEMIFEGFYMSTHRRLCNMKTLGGSRKAHRLVDTT